MAQEQTRAGVPVDRCPYPRPFDFDFADCPAFMPRLHMPTDTHGRHLEAAWTCAHLDTGRRTGGGFYGACLLGSAEDRAAWSAVLRGERLESIRRARVELSQFIRPQLEQVRQLVAARARCEDGRPPRHDVDSGWTQLVGAFSQFVKSHPELFESAGIDGEELENCFAEAMSEFAGRHTDKGWQMAESVVTRYPWPIIAFFRPDLIRDIGLQDRTKTS